MQILTDWPCVLKNKAVYFVKREKVRNIFGKIPFHLSKAPLTRLESDLSLKEAHERLLNELTLGDIYPNALGKFWESFWTVLGKFWESFCKVLGKFEVKLRCDLQSTSASWRMRSSFHSLRILATWRSSHAAWPMTSNSRLNIFWLPPLFLIKDVYTRCMSCRQQSIRSGGTSRGRHSCPSLAMQHT